MTTLGRLAATAAAGALTLSAGHAPAQTASANEARAVTALVVRLEVKPGKADEMIDFLRSGRAVVEDETGTTTWYAVRLGPTTFGIFDTFVDDASRDAHLNGRIPQALAARAADLLASPPVIEPAEILSSKIP